MSPFKIKVELTRHALELRPGVRIVERRFDAKGLREKCRRVALLPHYPATLRVGELEREAGEADEEGRGVGAVVAQHAAAGVEGPCCLG